MVRKPINAKLKKKVDDRVKLNIGCGKDVRKGWINLDNHKSNGANIVHDLNKLPLPFENNSADYLYCSHVLEDFVDFMPLMSEFCRIVKKDGIIEIRVPNETCTWDSPYHKRSFNLETFNIISKGNYRYEKNKSLKLTIKKSGFYGVCPLSKFNSFWLNIFKKIISPFFVSNTPIKYLFPLTYVYCYFEVKK